MPSPTSAAKKKDIEVHYLERLRAAMPDFPEGQIEPTEEPDFLIHGATSTIGIELTELHRDGPVGVKPQQALEAMRHRVVARAQELYVAKGLPPVKVSVFMRDSHDIKKEHVQTLAEALCQLVERNLPAPNSSKKEEYDWVNRSHFPEPILEVSVHRLDVITKTFFSVPGATWVSTLSNTDIQRALAPKEPKYPTYRLKCDQAWLVINADIGPMSTWFEFDASVPLLPLRTQFERVFVLRHFGSRLLELQVSR
jgi:hypothetical protein